ncbi:sigma-54-dependent Fis family transcriptional regulator [Pseudogemmobacter humi]|uniref:Acetoin dehydrogenase operon transcriptional activator AcoR n=1 Tax=Pseudogemmobacter humi TaxID=2483812 RepID=A0A3P5XPV2_9RHOB|nr:sigma 54-interacting transcriptional regulator [Pseudogemmobacter humi]VDC33752.1 Acetoin dehydrogenase operon transcriptional activator AcoR [Pseudogemmobacter humi]
MAESIQKEDWERFRALGKVPPSIREVVLRSWVRSRDNRDIVSLTCAPSVAKEELNGYRKRSSRLRTAAHGAFQRAGYMLGEAGAMLLLSDSRGIILDAVGDPRILSRGEENHLHPGGRWDERAIGTNAIGTALHTGRAVTIAGTEHFCEAIQRWSCAAAPVHDPATGQLLGAIDISAPTGLAFAQVAAFSVSLSMQIEEALRSAALHEREVLLQHLLSSSARHDDNLAIFDRNGQQIWASGRASGVVSSSGLEDLNDTAGRDVRQLAEHFSVALPGAGVDLVVDRGEAVGLILRLPSGNARSVNAGTSLAAIAATGASMAMITHQALEMYRGGLPLLIKGPAGSGKETLARALHEAGKPLPIELVDCSLLDAASLRGDASGGWMSHLLAKGGTLILDEPVETAPATQASLSQALAHLQRRAQAPIRLISVSSEPLSERLASGHLRADLYFRLSGAILHIPALSERRNEVPDLVRLFSERYSDRRKGSPLRFTRAAMIRLQAYAWPGNLRELRNLIETLSVTSFSRLIDVADLPTGIAENRRPRREETLRDHERTEILDAVAMCNGNMTETARRLGISRSTLYLKLEQYGVPRGRRH